MRKGNGKPVKRLVDRGFRQLVVGKNAKLESESCFGTAFFVDQGYFDVTPQAEKLSEIGTGQGSVKHLRELSNRKIVYHQMIINY